MADFGPSLAETELKIPFLFQKLDKSILILVLKNVQVATQLLASCLLKSPVMNRSIFTQIVK